MRHRARLATRVALAVLGIAALGLTVFLAVVFIEVRAFFRQVAVEDDARRAPSRLFGRAVELRRGEPLSGPELETLLTACGYAVTAQATPAPGRYRLEPGHVLLSHRGYDFPDPDDQPRRGTPVELTLGETGIDAIAVGGVDAPMVALGAPLIACFYGPELIEHRDVRLDDLPDAVVHAVLAAEDDQFFRHPGVSLYGIVRAATANLEAGRIRQGGSTISQQLVKNRYLTAERTFMRKLREAMLAVLLEWRYTKREILEAYMNEIYLGASGPVSVVGLEAASRWIFGEPAARLSVEQAATIAGMIHEPGRYSMMQRPEQLRRRRNWVIRQMRAAGWLSRARAEAAEAAPLDVAPRSLGRRLAPYFAEAVEREVRRSFGVELAAGGHTILSTLDLAEQLHAERAVAVGLAELEARRRTAGHPLQAALVSLAVPSGAVRAWVGGRDHAASQFDRVDQARRPAASAFKPVVYAAAIEARVALPSDFLDGSPLVVETVTGAWQPGNDDGSFHGPVSLRTALQKSLNVPTVRLALTTGMPAVARMAEALGLPRADPLPSLALGALDVTPLEMAAAYATFGGGGLRPTPYMVERLVSPRGQSIGRELPAPPESVLSIQTAAIMTSLLQGVIERGTGWSARRYGLTDRLAGKTGTSNDRRDAWFAGYSPDRSTVVWVGRDDNQPAGLSGARAALPIWARFVVDVRPPAGYPEFTMPDDVVTAVIDPGSGLLATRDCPSRITEVFPIERLPWQRCISHRPLLTPLAFDPLVTAGPEGGVPALPPLTGGFGAPIAAAPELPAPFEAQPSSARLSPGHSGT